MCHHHKTVNLGFAEAELPAGTHMCQIYSDTHERDEWLLKFLSVGLRNGERGTCFSNDIDVDRIAAYCNAEGIDVDAVKSNDALTVSDVSSVYFRGAEFNPENMLALLGAYYDKAMADGFSAARVIGEMTAEINQIKGGKRLLEYECRVNMLVREKPVIAMCQYSANNFDGAMIMEVLRVHPMMIVSGAVVQNPFFIPPEAYLARREYVE